MNPAAPVPAWIAIGGNQGEVRATLEAAIEAVDALPGTRVLQRSTLYRTPAWGRTDQPDFINGVIAVETGLAAPDLLGNLLGIERRFGRLRDEDAGRWGPRTLDLDLLLYDDQVLELPGLSLPHPRLHERAFVLVPLAEISPGLVVPGRGRVDGLLAKVDASGIEAIP
ncbi:2-amino-4-hydroxy-6-hydroxymethyldihydropteridine diphosphokinase [Arenimonas soli]|uniref:2-amino-4-hydroxy-6-hydroxymethyldihydropteridine pyrophosphokinase n=1 Tax=Arenimonas soli TaxID=2269504 RepID=A0ABQ1HED9_9GAMM|nr:2-amino-4-hydroxy-6-hydroxymethyldihydropteridine diphosphokinase [Arenimonas soli]GGA72329.1 2-amino-4-hydroxy-6-hydroxymethyldihydropteridine diphosphokinase [Arenimonas soli]